MTKYEKFFAQISTQNLQEIVTELDNLKEPHPNLEALLVRYRNEFGTDCDNSVIISALTMHAAIRFKELYAELLTENNRI